jgi:membrane-associated protein
MLDPVHIIQTAGLIGIFLVIFAESGVFFGFFLPGDSLLFTSGIFAHLGFFNIEILVLGCIASAILGGFVGYYTGKKVGPRLFVKEASLFFKKKYVLEAEHFYQKHGNAAILLARFIPIIRTFAPIMAGVGKMRLATFSVLNIMSGIIWPLVVTVLGYYIGSKIPNAQHYLLPISLGIILLSVAPIILRFARKLISK